MSKPRYNLYANWSRYAALFPVEEDDTAFFDKLMPRAGMVLDYGAGSAVMARRLATPERHVIALDPVAQQVKTAGLSVRASGLAIPFAAGSIHGLYSRLFGLAYASAVDESAPLQAITEVARILAGNAPVALELPLSWQPHRLGGVGETARLINGCVYRNQYQELVSRSELGALYHFLIELEDGESIGEINGRVFVFKPRALVDAFAQLGFAGIRFHAAYDLQEPRDQPPPDVLRGILYAEKRAG